MTDYSDPVSRGMVDHRLGESGAGPLTEDQASRIRALRESARLMSRHIVASCPPSPERDRALDAADNASSWAARAIARNEGGPTEE